MRTKTGVGRLDVGNIDMMDLLIFAKIVLAVRNLRYVDCELTFTFLLMLYKVYVYLQTYYSELWISSFFQYVYIYIYIWRTFSKAGQCTRKVRMK